ncbi:SDR family oxidoreductase [Bradyrhizobium sp.]|uniref:SDR family oxidoreductase n=1 Tax=Bradyrhizobium sp. TaxID=376 RepID=UPI0025BB7F3C|nr:SDR family oxidoreductase [Bradyrhizobium sp.]
MGTSGMALDGKVAIVTGASSGIGRAIALLFASEGARLVVAARRRELLEGLVAEIETAGGAACALAGDVSDESFSSALVEQTKSRFGGLDIAVNNAGVLGPMMATPDVTRDAWDETMSTNLTSAFLGAKYQIPAMLARGKGSLIFVSSFVGYTAAMPGAATYAASKAGQIGLMKALAVEYGPRGIRVNALLPGGTQTAAADAMADTEEMKAFVRNMHALKRIAAPKEQARAALFLASDAASFLTGSAMLVDGGVSINKT